MTTTPQEPGSDPDVVPSGDPEPIPTEPLPETDHTQGTVFGDRLPTKLRKKLQKAHEKAADEFPDGWPADSPA